MFAAAERLFGLDACPDLSRQVFLIKNPSKKELAPVIAGSKLHHSL
jgi:hypothetical protein